MKIVTETVAAALVGNWKRVGKDSDSMYKRSTCCNYEETSSTFVISWKPHLCNIARHLQNCGAQPFSGRRKLEGKERLCGGSTFRFNTECIYSGDAETS